MPSYRRDRPGPRSSAREEEPERRRSFLREKRPSLPREEFASRPVSPSERTPELWEILVPESERKDPYFDYSTVFSVFSGRRGPPPAPREEPRGESYRAGRERPPSVDPSIWFDLPRIWSGIEELRRDPRFRRGSPVAIFEVAKAQPTEADRAAALVRFFRVPENEVAKYPGQRIWDGLLHPFLDELSRALNEAKPRNLPGQLFFQEGRDHSFWLAYSE